MKFFSVNTRLIVILGYCILVILAISGFIAIYQETLKSSEISGHPVPKQELVGLSNTLATMYRAEGAAGLLTVTQDTVLKHEYDSLMFLVFDQIDTLKSISTNPELLSNLDSLSNLLIKKQNNALEMVQLMDKFENSTIKEITRTKIFSGNDVEKLNSMLINKTQQLEDTTHVVAEKKGLFKRVRDAIANKQDTTQQVSWGSVSYVEEVLLPAFSDTIVEYIQEVNLITQKKNAEIIRQVVYRQNQLHQMNELTSIQINQIMDDIENLEYQNNLAVLQERTESLENSTAYVAFIGLLALAVAIFFMSWTLDSVNRGIRLQKEIQEAKKDVDKLLISREQLIYTITHDIKAPISSIIGFLDLMTEDKPTPKQKYYIENMNSSATHIIDLVRNLLDFQSLEKNNQQLNKMSFSPYSLLQDIYDSFIPLAEKKKQKFDIHFEMNEEDKYLSDPYRIRQILNNIISNAIKFTPERGIVKIKATVSGEKSTAYLKVSVKDSGPGIDENDKAKIFEEFTRLVDTKKTEGTGLGLNISRRLSNLLGGDIEIESVKGQGANFILTLPLIQVFPAVEIVPVGDSENHDIRILFVDDDIVQLNLLSELMKKESIPCMFCSSSVNALELLKTESFDIIFTDIQMPDMKGDELVEEIRKSDFPGTASVPIIGLSADYYGSKMDIEKSGFNGFLLKPFRPKQLLQTIEKYTGKSIYSDVNYPNQYEFDFQNIMKFVSDDEDLALTVIDSFIDETTVNSDLLKQAFLSEDWESVKQLCHKMSSLMKMISADEIVSLLIDFENGSQSEEKKLTLLHLLEKKIDEAKEAHKILVDRMNKK